MEAIAFASFKAEIEVNNSAWVRGYTLSRKFVNSSENSLPNMSLRVDMNCPILIYVGPSVSSSFESHFASSFFDCPLTDFHWNCSIVFTGRIDVVIFAASSLKFIKFKPY